MSSRGALFCALCASIRTELSVGALDAGGLPCLVAVLAPGAVRAGGFGCTSFLAVVFSCGTVCALCASRLAVGSCGTNCARGFGCTIYLAVVFSGGAACAELFFIICCLSVLHLLKKVPFKNCSVDFTFSVVNFYFVVIFSRTTGSALCTSRPRPRNYYIPVHSLSAAVIALYRPHCGPRVIFLDTTVLSRRAIFTIIIVMCVAFTIFSGGTSRAHCTFYLVGVSSRSAFCARFSVSLAAVESQGTVRARRASKLAVGSGGTRQATFVHPNRQTGIILIITAGGTHPAVFYSRVISAFIPACGARFTWYCPIITIRKC